MASQVQTQYWNELYELRSHAYYVELLLASSEKIDKRIKIFLAIASSSGIAGWAVWQSAEIVWASIIALSQVLTAIIPFLPYRSRIKQYSAVVTELEELLINAELRWHEYSSGDVSDSDINRARFEIRKQKNKILRKHIPTTVSTNARLMAKAEESAAQHIANYY